MGSFEARNIAASSAGSVVATIQAGTAAAAGLTTIGTINAGTVTGLHTLDLGGAIVARYLKTTITSTGGTGIVAASVAAQARTVTD